MAYIPSEDTSKCIRAATFEKAFKSHNRATHNFPVTVTGISNQWPYCTLA